MQMGKKWKRPTVILLSHFSRVRLCDPVDGSPPVSSVPGILQARTLEWVAISFSKAWKWKVKVKSLSHVRLERPHGLEPSRLLCPWDFPGKYTGVGCHCLLRQWSYSLVITIHLVMFMNFTIFFWQSCVWDLSSQMRDWTHATCRGSTKS